MGTMEDLLERTDAWMMDGVMDTGGWETVSRVVSGASWARMGEQGGGYRGLMDRQGSECGTESWVANWGE